MKNNLPDTQIQTTIQTVTDLYEAYSSALLGYVLKIIPDAHQAHMILQKVFTEYHDKAEVSAISTNVFVSLLNKARNEAIEALINTCPLRVNSSGSRSVAMNSPHLQAYFQTLPLIEKTIMALNFYRGLTVKETADFLLLPLPLVQTKLQSALQKLHEHHAQKSKSKI